MALRLWAFDSLCKRNAIGWVISSYEITGPIIWRLRCLVVSRWLSADLGSLLFLNMTAGGGGGGRTLGSMTLALEPEISFAKIPQKLSCWTSVAELSKLWPLLRRTSWPLEGWRAVIRITVIGLLINLQGVGNRRLAEVFFVKGCWEHHFVLLMAHFIR